MATNELASIIDTEGDDDIVRLNENKPEAIDDLEMTRSDLLRQYSLGAGDGLSVPVAGSYLPVDGLFERSDSVIRRVPLLRNQSYPEMLPPPALSRNSSTMEATSAKGLEPLHPLEPLNVSLHSSDFSVTQAPGSGGSTSEDISPPLGCESNKKRKIVLDHPEDKEPERETVDLMPLKIPTTPFQAKSNQSTELHEAVDAFNPGLLEESLEKLFRGKSTITLLEATDEHGYTALMKACAINKPQGSSMVRILLEANGSVFAEDLEGYSSLHWAAASGTLSTLHQLVEAGADVNTPNTKNGEYPLHRAVRYGRSDSAQLLLNLGANLNCLNHALQLPLDVINLNLASPENCLQDQIRKLLIAADPSRKLMLLHHPECLDHETAPGHQESPQRIAAIVEAAQHLDLTLYSGFGRAPLTAIEKVHSKQYVRCVVELSEKIGSGGPVAFTPRVQQSRLRGDGSKYDVNLDSDTTFSAGSLNAALRACGAALHAVDLALLVEGDNCSGRRRTSFCVVRPPGHHSGVKGLLHDAPSCGFCIFNTACVAALHALTEWKLSRVAIIDFDVHHGNGSEDIVRALGRPDAIFFASAHLFDGDFYPGSGKGGSGQELASNVLNLGIPPLWRKTGVRSMDEQGGRLALRRAFSHRLCAALRAFNPELVVLSAGFDGGKHDVGNKRFGNRSGSIGLDLRPEDYHFLTTKIREVAEICCEGRVVSVLEGGYGRVSMSTPTNTDCCEPLDLTDFTSNAEAHIRALNHLPLQAISVLSPVSQQDRPSTRRTTRAHSPAVVSDSDSSLN